MFAAATPSVFGGPFESCVEDKLVNIDTKLMYARSRMN